MYRSGSRGEIHSYRGYAANYRRSSPGNNQTNLRKTQPIQRRPISASSSKKDPEKTKSSEEDKKLPPKTTVPSSRLKITENRNPARQRIMPLGKPPIARKPSLPASPDKVVTEEPSRIEAYSLGKHIGQGAYASVRMAVHKESKLKYAVKTYEKFRLMQPHRKRCVQQEIKIMKMLQHPSIVKLHETIDTPKQLHLVMEYVPGTSLHGYIKRRYNRRLEEPEVKRILKELVTALEYCHSRSVAHRDIKLENILLGENKQLKLIDFGFSTSHSLEMKTRIFCGTPSYMAPEIVTRKDYTGPPADIWACGILLFAMLCGTFPFKGSSDKELYRKIQRGQFYIPQHVPTGARNLLQRILRVDPKKRLSVQGILEDTWLNSSEINKVPSYMSDEVTTKASSVNGEALDLDVLCNMKKLGFTDSELVQELQDTNSHASSLYRKLKTSKMSENFKPYLSAGIK